jgi:hypothetical protein
VLSGVSDEFYLNDRQLAQAAELDAYLVIPFEWALA